MNSYIIIFVIVVIACELYRNSYKNRYLRVLSLLLYKKQDYETYFQKLNSIMAKLLFSKFNLKYMELNGCIAKEDKERISQLIEEIDNMKLNEKERINFSLKKLVYYSNIKEEGQARIAWKEINDSTFESIKLEAKQIIDIYIYHKYNHIDELEKIEGNLTGINQGIAQYRLAKQYYYKNDKEKCLEFAKKAYVNFKNTSWQSNLKSIIDGNYELLD